MLRAPSSPVRMTADATGLAASSGTGPGPGTGSVLGPGPRPGTGIGETPSFAEENAALYDGSAGALSLWNRRNGRRTSTVDDKEARRALDAEARRTERRPSFAAATDHAFRVAGSTGIKTMLGAQSPVATAAESSDAASGQQR